MPVKSVANGQMQSRSQHGVVKVMRPNL